MQSTNTILDDLARVASGAMNTVLGVRHEFEGRLREQVERILLSMDLVPRDEFDAVKAIAAEARAHQEILEQRVAALEARLAGDSGAPSPKKK
jgi:BMFP domain-containing protein YqiC